MFPQVQEPHARDRRELAVRITEHTGIDDPRILDAFRRVPRHAFVPPHLRDHAHEDRALAIGLGQTISQPSMIALMLKALECAPEHRALEVGAGSGYAAALLGELVAEVHAIEVLPELAERAQATLAALGVDNVTIYAGNGAFGLPDRAPFDRILVSAAAEHVPPALLDQLAVGGRIAVPVGGTFEQELLIGTRRTATDIDWERSTPCVFVPLVGNTPAQG
jgi:protein-L-isoaspartate(D-aspartate) O-methyltransferase